MSEERDFLLKSLDDLEVEFAAGDMDRSDYEQLKADYTVRAAAVIRSIEGVGAEPRPVSRPKSEPVKDGQDHRDHRSRAVMWLVGLTAFALLLGILIARTAGERGVNDQITGSIEESIRDKVLRCQQTGQDTERLLESLTCFDEVILEDPQNVEALTYRGWYVFLASRNADEIGATDDAAELLLSSGRFLDRAVEVDPTFPDARAFRAIVLDRLGQVEAACTELAALADLNPPPMIAGLTAPLVDRLGC